MADLKKYVLEKCERAQIAARRMAVADTATKNSALLAMADAIGSQADRIKTENAKDLEVGRDKGLSDALIDRLRLDDKGILGMQDALSEIAEQPDPVGAIEGMVTRPTGIDVGKMRVPVGVVGIIYESRPNVTADAAALCLKSGNACILRGGSEAIHSNVVLAEVLSQAGTDAGLPENAVQLIDITDRETVTHLAQAEGLVDLIIPRGGEGLIRAVVDAATIPVIKHFSGNCHVYIDADADLKKADDIAFNAKVQRPGVCNAAETLLIHNAVAQEVIGSLFPKMREAGVELRGCARTCAIDAQCAQAIEEDWDTEYLDLILAVKIVDTMDDAVDHITKHGSKHTDAIVTQDYTTSRRFVASVDSSSVMVNASTRFSDGGVYGLGAEIGISTDKLHARGPMGAADLTTYKWVVFGDGAIRE